MEVCEGERFGLALLDLVENSSKPQNGLGFEISAFGKEAKKIFIAMARGEECAASLKNLTSIRERAILIHWQHLRRFPSPGLVEHFDTVTDTEDHFRNYESAILNSTEYKNNGRYVLSNEALFEAFVLRGPKVFIDVSNTINSKARTGIQRVVREVGERLASTAQATLIYTNRTIAKFVEVSPGDLNEKVEPKLSGAPEVTFQKGDLYFDIDASWGEPLNKFRHYAALKEAGVRIITMHHDAVPILFPHFSHDNTVGRFIEHFLAAITFSDRILCNSEAVRRDLQQLCRKLRYRTPKSAVIRLGSDFKISASSSPVQPEAQEVIAGGHYVLCVGTVEPRKNYSEILSCLPRISELGLKLVIVGKVGWENADVIRALEEASQDAEKLIWLKNTDDASLHELYKNCDLLIAASFYEGFGLPIIEGLLRDCIIVSSDGGALPEVLGDRGVVFRLGKPNSLPEAIATATRDQSLRTELRSRAEKFVPSNWQDTISDLSEQFSDFFGPIAPKRVETIQLVYMSIRPKNLARSLASFAKHFGTPISNVLVLTRGSEQSEVRSALHSAGFTGTVVLDEDLLSEPIDDHAERNFALRSLLYASEHIEQIFLALDDDAVLLRPTSIEHFIRDGLTSAFCFHPSMSMWRASPFSITSYDVAQWRTGSVLSNFGYEDVAFTAHHPQLILRNIAREIFDEFHSLTARQLDEWSIYFNVAASRYPDAFKIRRSTTLFWPDRLNSWQPEWFNDDIYFENFYTHNYEPGGLAYEYGIFHDGDWRVKRAIYAGEYNKYYFQQLLDQSFVDISSSIVETSNGPSFSNEAVIGFAALWKPVVTDCDPHDQITYEVRQNSKLVVDGLEPQTVGRQRYLYIKCPATPGTYDLCLFKFGRQISKAILITLPLAGASAS